MRPASRLLVSLETPWMTTVTSPSCTPEDPTLESRSLAQMSRVWTLISRHVEAETSFQDTQSHM